MTTIASTATPVTLAPVRLASLVGLLRRAVVRRRRYVTTVHALEVLSDRQLDDIGVMRCDIEKIARKAAAD